MKHLFLDFDRTLFNTELFYNSMELKYVLGMNRFPKGFDFSKFLYPDTIGFLKFAKSFGWKIHLLTFGEREIQEYKLKASGIEKYFDNLFYVQQGRKVDVVLPLLQNRMPESKEIVYIDDVCQHLADFQSELPDSKVFKMARRGAKGSETEDSRFLKVTNLNQVRNFIQLNNVKSS